MTIKLNSLSAFLLSRIAEEIQGATGYNLCRDMNRSHYWRCTHQQVYRELHKLQKSGLLTCDEIQNRGKPDAKLYKITRTGLNVLDGFTYGDKALEPVHGTSTAALALDDKQYFKSQVALLKDRLSSISTEIDVCQGNDDKEAVLLLSRERSIRLAELEFALEVLA